MTDTPLARAVGQMLYGTRTVYADLASGQTFIFPTAPEGKAPVCRKMHDGWYSLPTGQQCRTCDGTPVVAVEDNGQHYR